MMVIGKVMSAHSLLEGVVRVRRRGSVVLNVTGLKHLYVLVGTKQRVQDKLV